MPGQLEVHQHQVRRHPARPARRLPRRCRLDHVVPGVPSTSRTSLRLSGLSSTTRIGAAVIGASDRRCPARPTGAHPRSAALDQLVAADRLDEVRRRAQAEPRGPLVDDRGDDHRDVGGGRVRLAAGPAPPSRRGRAAGCRARPRRAAPSGPARGPPRRRGPAAPAPASRRGRPTSGPATPGRRRRAPRRAARRLVPRRPSSTGSAGDRDAKPNVLPHADSVLSSHIRPPNSSTMRRDSVRPRPVPSSLAVRGRPAGRTRRSAPGPRAAPRSRCRSR